VRIIVPFAPAGPTDNQARWAAQQLTVALGQQFIIENRPGAGGVPGTEAVAKSAHDGYTLLAGNPGPLTIAPACACRCPMTRCATSCPSCSSRVAPAASACTPACPRKTSRSFVTLARAQPGRINYGTPGVGTVGHLATELFATQAGVKLNHIPYKGAAQYTVDLIAGNIELAINQFAISAPLVNAGKVRCLGVTSRERTPLLPNAPTIAEQGIKDFESYNWNGMLAPAGTPPAVINRIAEIVSKQLATPEARALYSGQGHEASGIVTTAYADFIRAETEKWAKVARTANIPKQ